MDAQARSLVQPLVVPFALLVTLSGPALAQPFGAAVIPPGGTPIPQLEPPSQPRLGPGMAPPAPARPGAAPEGSASVREVAFLGTTAFTPAELIAATGSLTGAATPIARIEEARAAIVTLYRDRGYPFVTADATLGADGVLRFQVAEGYVTEVKLDGDIGPAGTQVLRFLNRLVNVQPLDIASLERQLLLAQDIPGLTVRSVLRPAGTAPGALSLVAQVSRQAVSGYVTADNRGPRFSGPFQALGSVQFNSFTSLGERTELQIFYARDTTQVFGQASWQGFVGGSGLQVRLYAGHGRTNPSGQLRQLGYEGESTVAGIQFLYPAIRRRSQTLNLVGSFDAIETEIWVDGSNGQQQRLSRDSLRVLRAGGDWSVYDLLAGDTRPATNFLSIRLSQGLDGFGASASGPGASRPGARTDFTKISGEISRTQALFSPWNGAVVSLQGTLAGQWSNDVLPVSEKYYLGGNRLGRGFYAGEVTGDNALAVSAELQLSTSHEFTAWRWPIRLLPTYYLFYDQGWTYENRASDPNRELRSAGIGVRMQVNERFEAQFEGVRRFTRQPQGPAVPAQHEDAFFWRVLARF
ncbi:ShlB/FhaC/HecB family hemolysin secretion/activation protein [Roseococcus sp. YIM B11640]|uniref:ShlB/FhaC/HecB family hemolysin secretion/activation protein n=1 Tax=Roseococcus sp. YIM B11640 TaxID=3133973 RepID=UPI003C7B0D81